MIALQLDYTDFFEKPIFWQLVKLAHYLFVRNCETHIALIGMAFVIGQLTYKITFLFERFLNMQDENEYPAINYIILIYDTFLSQIANIPPHARWSSLVSFVAYLIIGYAFFSIDMVFQRNLLPLIQSRHQRWRIFLACFLYFSLSVFCLEQAFYSEASTAWSNAMYISGIHLMLEVSVHVCCIFACITFVLSL